MDGKPKSSHPSGIPIPRRIRRSASQTISPRLSRRDQYQSQAQDQRDQRWESGSEEGREAKAPLLKQLHYTQKRLLQSSDSLGLQTKVRKGGVSENVLRQSVSCGKLVTKQPQESTETEVDNQVS